MSIQSFFYSPDKNKEISSNPEFPAENFASLQKTFFLCIHKSFLF
ncbi:hypothetical protein BACCOPRO_00505 [Phocaeicola coprophilus DSM 18228 = JCM 13818]|uniref:Uncharacterized protein n=1 Tax=Phocaeicola coprophilus DSM 18228 = JCM 13818 TaxID=547042 RepID=S0F4G8_9BACT|nr:hypothetical protein BACCOPRO_00505 [Phocaeicola coprophilus DSM 18228 = JCM 13818]